MQTMCMSLGHENISDLSDRLVISQQSSGSAAQVGQRTGRVVAEMHTPTNLYL